MQRLLNIGMAFVGYLGASLTLQAGTLLNSPREFIRPPASEAWVTQLRWNDPYRYHFGPLELAHMYAAPTCLIAQSYGGKLSCLDYQHGYVHWQQDLKRPLVGNLVAHAGRGYFVSKDGWLMHLGLSTGQILEKTSLGTSVIAEITYHEGHLYFLTATHELWKWNVESREAVWKLQDEIFQKVTLLGGTRPYVHPDGMVIVGVPNGGVVAVDSLKGTRRWEVNLPTHEVVDDVDATPVPWEAGQFVISTAYSSTQLMNAQGKDVLGWSRGAPRSGRVAKILLSQESLLSQREGYIQGDLGQLRILDLKSGDLLRSLDVPLSWGYPQTPENLDNRFFLFVFSHGPVVVWDIQDNRIEEIYSAGVGFSSVPVVQVGKQDVQIYLISNYGGVRRLDLRRDLLFR
jgi:outer membrane protein assembly factor BamB